MTAQDALEFLVVGATAVQVGTANFVNPRASMEIVQGIERFVERKKLDTIMEFVGSLKPNAV